MNRVIWIAAAYVTFSLAMTTPAHAETRIVAKPGILALYHVLFYGAPIESALNEVEALYDGEVVLANDLDIF